MRIDTLVRMGQQIARNNATLPPDRAVERIAGHLRSFWTPGMIADLTAFADTDGGLDPLLRQALAALKA